MDGKVQHSEGGTSKRHQAYDGPNGLHRETSRVSRESSQLKEDDQDSGIGGKEKA